MVRANPKTSTSDPGMILGQVLLDARLQAGVTQVELARRLRKPQPAVSLLERGDRRVDVIEFCAIARALGREPVELFGAIVAGLTA